jgi:hypothetical protein
MVHNPACPLAGRLDSFFIAIVNFLTPRVSQSTLYDVFQLQDCLDLAWLQTFACRSQNQELEALPLPEPVSSTCIG